MQKFILFFLVFLLLGFPIFGQSSATGPPVGNIERDYYIKIELSQWKIIAYDMNHIEDLVFQGVDLKTAIKQSQYENVIPWLNEGSQVYLEIYSLDIEHRISIKEYDIRNVVPIATKPVWANFILTEGDYSFVIECHESNGPSIGHSDMRLRLEVGNGGPNHGKSVINFALVANGLIVLIFAYKILKTSNPPKKRAPKSTDFPKIS